MKLVINFKTYKKGTGKEALKLAKIIDKYRKKADIYLAVQNIGVHRISKSVKVKVIGQHVDPIDYGKNTGYNLAEALKFNGAKGSLINHSEHRIKIKEIKEIVKRFKKLKLKSIVCVKDLNEAKKVKKFKPDFIALEDKKLIGTGKSISKNVKLVKAFLKIVPNGLIGAGISAKEDVKESLKLGAKGILIASAIVKSNNANKKLKELLG